MISKRVLLLVAALLVVSATTAMGAPTNANSIIVNRLETDGGQLNLIDWGIVKVDTKMSGVVVTPAYIGVRDQQIAPAYDFGAWDGTVGLTNLAAQANGGVDALGIMTVDDYKNQLGLTTFNGVDLTSVAGTACLIQHTQAGDTTFKGFANTDDLITIASNIDSINTGTPVDGTWLNGDVTYDGQINTDDLITIANTIDYNNTHPVAGAAAVPEPATMVLALMALASCFAIRKFWK
jgi:hypothetical protein